jgi:hypothetical protein
MNTFIERSQAKGTWDVDVSTSIYKVPQAIEVSISGCNEHWCFLFMVLPIGVTFSCNVNNNDDTCNGISVTTTTTTN